jgi:sugar phosphate permease
LNLCDFIVKMNRLKLWQGAMFAVTFLAMVTRHACLSAWAISKTNVHDEEGFSKPELGYFDTSFLFFYAIGNFISGVLGDNFPLRYVTAGGMLIATGAYLAVTPTQIVFFGYGGASNFAAFMVFWAISGLAQSAVWPGGVAVISNWYPKGTRGQVMGWWSSNSSVGDIVGQQIGGLMLGVLGLSWKAVMLVTSSLLGASAILFALVVRDKPSKELMEQNQTDFSYQVMQEEGETPVPEVLETQKKGISFWKAWLLPG